MKSLVTKLGQLIPAIEQEKSAEFVLFALVLPEDAIAWDILAAAPWIDNNGQAALRYLANKIQKVLTTEELRNVSSIMLAETEEFGPITSLTRSLTGWAEEEVDFYGRKIRKGYMFVCPNVELQISPMTA